MSNFWQDFAFTFVPLFIVIDALGTLPYVISLSEDMTRPQRRRMVHLAVITAAVVGLVFLFLGQFILNLLGISVGAFAIAGGIILLVFAVQYMTTGHMVKVIKEELVAVVPIGTPLTAGPATITTLLLLATQYPALHGAYLLRPEHAHHLGHLPRGRVGVPFSGAGRAEGDFPGVQPAAGGYRREHGYTRAGVGWYN